ncbi:hypothetical protein [Brachybacterium sp. ACRRE]|uniref:hypothetical protein n=1 Tax=Brachybacterium sp. ACRRE TaxID=2918184 RepID=UPI001EF247C3|nr:hypothetical protein [Brachybacterium sp. ACRRE]MCG7308281.1 hypothetical protein [Brachybacterium sp. ACRRE]
MEITREEATARRRTFAQWAAGAYEPLLPISTRVDIDRRFREWTRRTPTFTIAWATGVAASILDTLPPNDPWRHPTPGFGTWRDAGDVTFIPDEEDEWDRQRMLLDLSLAAIADPMPPGAARVMAACAAGAEDGQFTLTDVRNQSEATRRDMRTADIAQSIVLWSLWRRRIYRGADDEFPLSMMYSWLSYALMVEDGRGVPHESIDPDVFTAALTDEDYRAVAGMDDESEHPARHLDI